MQQKRVVFDFAITFSNGGGLQGQAFRLDIDGNDISDAALADYLVRDMRLLMVDQVLITNKSIITEAHKRPQHSAETPEVLELRVAITTAEYERLARFYSAGLGIEPAHLWTEADDRALILALGTATLEIFDEAHATAVDQIEVGRRVSGPIRFALRVPDLQAALDRLIAHGATLVHPPVQTPWGHWNARVQDPDGLQVTLFQIGP